MTRSLRMISHTWCSRVRSVHLTRAVALTKRWKVTLIDQRQTVVASLFGLAGRLFGSHSVGPSLNSGLRLQRRSGGKKGTTNYHFQGKSEFDVCIYCASSGEDASCGEGLIGHPKPNVRQVSE